VEAEYLLWWMKGASVPPLVTSSPAGTPLSQAGVLGAPGTSVLFGGSDVNGGVRSGGRFAVGAWLDDCQTFGVEGGVFFLESKSAGLSAASGGNPILARPFTDAVTGRPASELVAFPGVASGNISASDSSTGLVGARECLRGGVQDGGQARTLCGAKSAPQCGGKPLLGQGLHHGGGQGSRPQLSAPGAAA
jgi:hypothetical protein